MKNTPIGAAIGRFQVDRLTDGHVFLLSKVRDQHDIFVIFVGVAAIQHTKRNPLTFIHIKKMLEEKYPAAVILPLMDCRTDEDWSKSIDEMFWRIFPGVGATLYGCRDSFIPHYLGRHKTEELQLPATLEKFSGTERREYIGKRVQAGVTSDIALRQGIIHTIQNLLPRVNLCVDIAYLKRKLAVDKVSIEILLGRKKNEKKWRLPGGYVDHSDLDGNAAARRELQEETNGIIEGPTTCLGTFWINDWRAARTPDVKFASTLYVGWHSFAQIRPGDDLEEVRFFPLDMLIPEIKNTVVEEHQSMFFTVEQAVRDGRVKT